MYRFVSIAVIVFAFVGCEPTETQAADTAPKAVAGEDMTAGDLYPWVDQIARELSLAQQRIKVLQDDLAEALDAVDANGRADYQRRETMYETLEGFADRMRALELCVYEGVCP